MFKTRTVSALGGAALAAGLVLFVTPLLGGAVSVQSPGVRATAVQKVFPSAVRIQVLAAGELVRSASGIAFAHRGGRTYVLTNAHVVERSRSWRAPVEVKAIPGAGPTVAAKVLATGRMPDVDLAVLELPGELPITTLAADEGLELGDDLVVIGAPFGKGLSVAAGIVSQIEYENAESAGARPSPTGLKTDAAIGYGSSGGGVFDVGGARLVGVVEGYRTARVAFGKDTEQYAFDVPMPGETFVAPAAKIRRFLRDSGLADLAPEPPPGSRGAFASPSPPRL
ncbi:MAG TPA: serine protease [Anaeromyxobacter sp.]